MDVETPNGENENKEQKKVEEEKKPRKRKLRRTELIANSTLFGRTSDKEIQQFKNEESNMKQLDILAVATDNAKNAFETYIYDMQDKLQYNYSELYEFITDQEREAYLKTLDESCTWLYNEGDNVSKEEYENRLNNLKVVGEPIKLRKSEFDMRETSVTTLKSCIEHYINEIQKPELYDHIEQEKLESIKTKCTENQNWLN